MLADRGGFMRHLDSAARDDYAGQLDLTSPANEGTPDRA
jgi:hypothetical protein